MEQIERLQNELKRFDGLALAPLKARTFTGFRLKHYGFFPGANGLFQGKDAEEFPQITTLILGSDFGSREREFDNDRNPKNNDERGGATWRPLLQLLERVAIHRDECFFTNAWPVLHEGGSGKKVSNENPPIDAWLKDERFMEECVGFFRFTLKVVKPKLVIALGKGPAVFLAHVWPEELKDWAVERGHSLSSISWPQLDRTVLPRVSFGGHEICCIAINHPSRQRLNAKHRIEPYRGIEGETKLLKEAAMQSNIFSGETGA